MEIKKRGFLTRLKLAVGNFDFANVIIKERTSTALKYFMVLALSIALVSGVMIYVATRPFFEEIVTELKNEVPDFNITNGKLHVDVEQPYYNDDEEILFVIDTTGIVRIEDLKAQTTTQDIVLLGSENMYFYSPDRGINYDYNYDLLNLDFDKADIIALFEGSKLALIISTLSAIFVFVGKMFGTLVAWILSGITASFKRLRLTGGQSYSLALYALTIPSLFNVIFNLGRMRAIYYLIVIIYLVKYMDAINNQQDQPEEINEDTFIVE